MAKGAVSAETIFGKKSLKIDEKCYFILKALFALKIFKFFVLTFWFCRENGLIRKRRLISTFMTSQPD